MSKKVKKRKKPPVWEAGSTAAVKFFRGYLKMEYAMAHFVAVVILVSL
jgi:hypothetical protein